MNIVHNPQSITTLKIDVFIHCKVKQNQIFEELYFYEDLQGILELTPRKDRGLK